MEQTLEQRGRQMNLMSIVKNRAVTFLAGFGACLTVLVMMGAQAPYRLQGLLDE
jgi:hypothetical protein